MASDSGFAGEIGAALPERRPQRVRYRSFRVITALMLREMATRFGRTPGGFVWAILQPLATIVILGLAFSLISRTPALGTSFLLFKGTGMMSFTMFKSTSSLVGRSLSFSSSLLAYPGVTWVDAILARAILNVMVTLIVTILILGGVIAFEGLTLILDWGSIALAMTLAALLGLGIGTLNCYLGERLTIWNKIWAIATAPLMIASGVILLYDDLPRFAQDILWYNPALHVTGLMRAGFYSTYQPTYISVTYVLLCAMVPMVIGLLLLRRYHLELLNR